MPIACIAWTCRSTGCRSTCRKRTSGAIARWSSADRSTKGRILTATGTCSPTRRPEPATSTSSTSATGHDEFGATMKSREDYDRAVVLTRTLVREWDPGGMLRKGAPDDEWDDEIARLVARIPRVAGADDAGRHIAEVFTAAFGRGVLNADASADFGRRWHAALGESGLLPP